MSRDTAHTPSTPCAWVPVMSRYTQATVEAAAWWHTAQGDNIVCWAVAAKEVRHDQPGQSREQYFAWLCVNEKRLA